MLMSPTKTTTLHDSHKAGGDENETGKSSVVAESSNKEQHKKFQSESQVENDDPCPDFQWLHDHESDFVKSSLLVVN